MKDQQDFAILFEKYSVLQLEFVPLSKTKQYLCPYGIWYIS